MGAILRNGYTFEVEYSQISKTAALQVYREGDFIEEITFPFKGDGPNQEKIEEIIDEYFE